MDRRGDGQVDESVVSREQEIRHFQSKEKCENSDLSALSAASGADRRLDFCEPLLARAGSEESVDGISAVLPKWEGGEGTEAKRDAIREQELERQDRERWAKADAYLSDLERVAAARATWERKEPKAETEALPRPNSRRVIWGGERFHVVFPYSAALVTAIKQVPGARWINAQKVWEVSELAGAELLRFAAQHGFEVEAEALGRAESAGQRAQANLEESRLPDTEFHVDNLGGTLRPFQRVGVSYASRQRRVIIADEMRLGKSMQALATLCHTESYPALLVVPATLKPAWRREAERWLPGRTVAVLEGKAPREPDNWIEVEPVLRYAERHAEWFAGCMRQLRSAEILIINYDILMDWAGVRWTVNERGKRIVDTCDGPLAAMLFRGLVCDEFHRHVLGRKAQRTLVLQYLAAQWRTECRERMHDMVQLLLSGTPMRKQAADLIQPLQIIDRLDDLGGWYQFATRYCGYAGGVMGSVRVPPEAMVELNQRLRSVCMVRRRRRDVYAEIPKVERHVVPFAIHNRAEYQKAEQDVAGWAADHALKDVEFNRSLEGMSPEQRREARKARAQDAAYRAMRAEGLVRISALKRLAAHGKMAGVTEWIKEFMEESGEKLIVGAWHQEIVEEVARRFSAPYIHGGVSAGKKDEAVTLFQRCAACGRSHELHYAADFPCPAYRMDAATPLIAINFQSGGMGLTLTAANDTAIVELGWTPDDMDQLEMRVGHIDKPDPANHWYLLAEGTIEEDIMAILDRRRQEVSAATDGDAAEEDRGMMQELLARMAARAA